LNSLSSVSHILPGQADSGIDCKHYAIGGREKLGERSSSETRMARKIDEMQRLSENDGRGL